MKLTKNLSELITLHPWLNALIVECIKWAKDNDDIVEEFELKSFAKYFDKPQTATQYMYKHGKGDHRLLSMDQVNEMLVLMRNGEIVDDVSMPYTPESVEETHTAKVPPKMESASRQQLIEYAITLGIFNASKFTDDGIRKKIAEYERQTTDPFLDKQSNDFKTGYADFMSLGKIGNNVVVGTEYYKGMIYAQKVRDDAQRENSKMAQDRPVFSKMNNDPKIPDLDKMSHTELYHFAKRLGLGISISHKPDVIRDRIRSHIKSMSDTLLDNESDDFKAGYNDYMSGEGTKIDSNIGYQSGVRFAKQISDELINTNNANTPNTL